MKLLRSRFIVVHHRLIINKSELLCMLNGQRHLPDGLVIPLNSQWHTVSMSMEDDGNSIEDNINLTWEVTETSESET